MELVRFWRRYMKEGKTIPPVTVPTGLLLQNASRGADVNLLEDSRARSGTSTTAAITSAPAAW